MNSDWFVLEHHVHGQKGRMEKQFDFRVTET
jgi:hypothetical protein